MQHNYKCLKWRFQELSREIKRQREESSDQVGRTKDGKTNVNDPEKL